MKHATLMTLALFSHLCGAQDEVFDSDPDHPWNRLHRELYTGTTLDGEPHYKDGLDAEMGSRPRFYVDDMSAHGAVVDALDEFLTARGGELVPDPVKRALMQRDLWAVFTETVSSSPDSHPQPRELHERLVRAMRSIALSPEEIDTLPDNLSQAANDGAFSATFDAQHPDRAFLPADLTQSDGPWVMLNRRRDASVTAPVHAHATAGRAAFLVLLRVPGGRQATVDYLSQLEEALNANGEAPQFPHGTEVAFLRRLMLIDNTGKLHVSPLTESLQIRVYQRIEAPDNFEFMVSREDLFGLRAGGLRPSQPHLVNDRDLEAAGIGFGAPASRDPRESSDSDTPRAPIEVQSCVICHAGPGIFGFQSVFSHHMSPLGPTNLQDQIPPAIEYTYKTPAWKLLDGIWREDSRP